MTPEQLEPTTVDDFLAATAHGLVEGQQALDERGLDSLDGWGETGEPPSVFAWSGCRLALPVAFGVAAAGEGPPVARIAPRTGDAGELVVSIRFLLRPQETLDAP